MEPQRDPMTAIFTRRPRPGEVKTRLSPPLEPGQAARLAQAMLDDVVANLLGHPALELVLAAPPGEDRAWFEQRYPELHRVLPQEGAGLGPRLASFFATHLPGRRSVVVVGSDCPWLSAQLVAGAHEALAAGAGVVFAPDTGGGYALVGLSQPASELFTDVPMSTPDNLRQTLAVARRLGLGVRLLEEQPDVDDGADLERLILRLATLEVDAPVLPSCTQRCLEQMGLAGLAPGGALLPRPHPKVC